MTNTKKLSDLWFKVYTFFICNSNFWVVPSGLFTKIPSTKTAQPQLNLLDSLNSENLIVLKEWL